MKTLNSSTRKPISLLPLLLVGGCSAETISTSFVVGIMVWVIVTANSRGPHEEEPVRKGPYKPLATQCKDCLKYYDGLESGWASQAR